MPVPAARVRADLIPTSGVRRITGTILLGLGSYSAALAIAG